MHLAAESHVDRSIDGPGAFVQTNVVGTFDAPPGGPGLLARLDRRAPGRLPLPPHLDRRGLRLARRRTGFFHEEYPYQPNSPYSASKAASDHFVRAWHHTYGLPTVITNCSNNYGPYHFPEKLIPLMILNALEGKPLPVYGRGENVRDWLYVEDHADALILVAEKGRVGRELQHRRLERAHEHRRRARRSARSSTRWRRMRAIGPRENAHHLRGRPARATICATPSTPARSSASSAGARPKPSRRGLRKTVAWYLDNRGLVGAGPLRRLPGREARRRRLDVEAPVAMRRSRRREGRNRGVAVLSVEPTAIPDVKIVTPKRFGDASRLLLGDLQPERASPRPASRSEFVQDNHSLSAARRNGPRSALPERALRPGQAHPGRARPHPRRGGRYPALVADLRAARGGRALRRERAPAPGAGRVRARLLHARAGHGDPLQGLGLLFRGARPRARLGRSGPRHRLAGRARRARSCRTRTGGSRAWPNFRPVSA